MGNYGIYFRSNTIVFAESMKILFETLSVYTLITHCNIFDTEDPEY